MGWQDREYNWDGESNYGGDSWRPPLVTAWLLGIHVVTFVLLQSVALEAIPQPLWYVLSPFGLPAIPWRGALALITVVLVFLILAARIERSDGPQTLLGLYLTGTVFSILAHLAFAWSAPQMAAIPVGPIPNGAFAAFAMFGLHRYRNEQVALFGAFVRSFSWVIGVFSLVVLAMQFLRMGPTGLGWLVGTFAGAMAAAIPTDRLDFSDWWQQRLRPRRKVVRPSIPRDPGPTESILDPDPPDPDSAVLDELLEKISREGLEALSTEEREKLEDLRTRLQGRP